MPTIALLIAYNGAAYSGWQIQDNAQSVQALVQKAVRTMTGETNRVMGASRTDTGVHAMGQVASFQSRKDIPAEAFAKGLKSYLPHTITIRAAAEVAKAFDPRRDTTGKHYRYIIHEAPAAHALLHQLAWHRCGRLNLRAMRKAAKQLVGKHDFTAFCATNDRNTNKVRQLSKITVKRVPFAAAWPLLAPGDGHGIVIDVLGTAFLKQMVRTIVGTLVEVGEARRDPSSIRTTLRNRDRRQAGPSAPGHGLYLTEIFYRPNPFK